MKTEVYSWRLSTDLKTNLEREARRRKISLSSALDLAAKQWLRRAALDDAVQQQQLQDVASRYVGILAGGNPRRAETASETLRERLRKKHAR
jgi:hypothetical protein